LFGRCGAALLPANRPLNGQNLAAVVDAEKRKDPALNEHFTSNEEQLRTAFRGLWHRPAKAAILTPLRPSMKQISPRLADRQNLVEP
jgi:hypothetical protein